jgi:hypothetical protein
VLSSRRQHALNEAVAFAAGFVGEKAYGSCIYVDFGSWVA